MRSEINKIPDNLEKEVKSSIIKGELLPLMEEFYTLQGEGAFTGESAYFIRVGGCDVGCHWCDVKESWDAGLHPPTEIKPIVENALKYPARTIVITGGEPLMYEMTPLTSALKAVDFQVHLETSGAYPLTGHFDWICLSPKKTKAPTPSIYSMAHELKVIIYNKNDFAWAEEHASKVGADCKLYLQPEWSRREKMIPELIAYVQEHPKWRLSLQSHKYLNIP
jgi:7-carboxy-7-deazaguanine synthase